MIIDGEREAGGSLGHGVRGDNSSGDVPSPRPGGLCAKRVGSGGEVRPGLLEAAFESFLVLFDPEGQRVEVRGLSGGPLGGRTTRDRQEDMSLLSRAVPSPHGSHESRVAIETHVR